MGNDEMEEGLGGKSTEDMVLFRLYDTNIQMSSLWSLHPNLFPLHSKFLRKAAASVRKTRKRHLPSATYTGLLHVL